MITLQQAEAIQRLCYDAYFDNFEDIDEVMSALEVLFPGYVFSVRFSPDPSLSVQNVADSEEAVSADLTIQANEVLLVVQSYLWHLQGANADAAEAEIFKAIRSALGAAYEAGRKEAA